ncbi:hypothetical protein GBA52_021866 [Prunus armeniaca]|nr:hypothetical protein GBA52_021866 [Prunus armeniaca]
MVSPKVPDQMKHFFVKPYNGDEVEIALKQMARQRLLELMECPLFFFSRNDILLFLEATPHACRTLKRVFEIHEVVAGQK